MSEKPTMQRTVSRQRVERPRRSPEPRFQPLKPATQPLPVKRLAPIDRRVLQPHPSDDLAPSLWAVCTDVARILFKPLFLITIFTLLVAVVARHRTAGLPILEAAIAPQSEEERLEQRFAAYIANSALEPSTPEEDAALIADLDVPELDDHTKTMNFIDRLLSPLYRVKPLNVEPPKPAATPQIEVASKDTIEDLKSKVKFIAGMIAVHRPSIPDCGLVAKEIVSLSSAKNIDPFLVAAIISVESNFIQDARSPVGARGMMQLMPATARFISSSDKRCLKGITDVHTNIDCGIDYYLQLERQYRGNKVLALSAYNWGPANVDRISGNYRQIPSGVKKYAMKVTERFRSWSNHYRKAKAATSSLENV